MMNKQKKISSQTCITVHDYSETEKNNKIDEKQTKTCKTFKIQVGAKTKTKNKNQS